MLKSLSICPAPNYTHATHTLEPSASLAPQLDYHLTVLAL